MDVKSVFINGELTKTMFVQQPPRIFQGEDDGEIISLMKALYGQRQPPMACKARLDASLHSLGFSRSKLEHAVYLRGHAKLFLLVGPMSMT
jgi:hypothetical protein